MIQRLEISSNGWKAGCCAERIRASKSPKTAEFLELVEFVRYKADKVDKLIVELSDDLYPKQAIKRMKDEIECGDTGPEIHNKINRLSLTGDQVSCAARCKVSKESAQAWDTSVHALQLALEIIAHERAIDAENEAKLFGCVGLKVTQTELTQRWDRLADTAREELKSFNSAPAVAYRNSLQNGPGLRMIKAIGV